LSGVVEHVGNNVTQFKKGDKVWTSTYYRDSRAGCFQEYVVVPQHTVLPIPSNLNFEEAACLGVAALTAAMTLWKWLDVPIPKGNTQKSQHDNVARGFETPQSIDSGYLSSESLASGFGEDQWILIWGGSTVTGQFATQLAALSNLKVVTVCSSQTAELSRSLGAEYVAIRDGMTAEQIAVEIMAITKGRIYKAIDLVGAKTAAQCLQICGSDIQVQTQKDHCKVLFAPLAMMGKDQEIPDVVQVETVEMKRFVLDPESRIYAQRLNDLIEDGKIKIPSLEVLSGGLARVQHGLDMLKKGNMGGVKLVVTL
jgi:NADPH:quinone reductase-like Zn-dependent oxidoreductase